MITPTIRADWRKLLLINYAIDPAILTPYVPFGTEPAFYDDKCFVSLVGFMFQKTRVSGIPVPLHVNFAEINLRFYVRRHNGKEWENGVVFIKEIVSLPMVTFVANTLFKENYETLPVRSKLTQTNVQQMVEYQWKKQKWHSMSITTQLSQRFIEDDTLMAFLTTQHYGFCKVSEDKTFEYNVAHPRWSSYEMISYNMDVDFLATYGKVWGFLNSRTPHSVFLSEGSGIRLRRSGG